MKSLAVFKKQPSLTEKLREDYLARVAAAGGHFKMLPLAETHTPTPMPARDRGVATTREVESPMSMRDAVARHGARTTQKKR